MKREFKFLKRNQIAIYVIALLLMAAGYLNYTTSNGNNFVQTSAENGLNFETNDNKLADIGDAQLVSSNDIVQNENANISKDSAYFSNNSNSETNTTVKQNSTEETDTIETNANTKIQDDYFSKSKLERDTMYSQMLETYEKVINSSNTLETQKQSATEEITKINNIKNSIMICENLIKTKGFENNIIFVNGESISVIIDSNEIKQEEIAQIQNIISREMNAKIENIHISNKF